MALSASQINDIRVDLRRLGLNPDTASENQIAEVMPKLRKSLRGLDFDEVVAAAHSGEDAGRAGAATIAVDAPRVGSGGAAGNAVATRAAAAPKEHYTVAEVLARNEKQKAF